MKWFMHQSDLPRDEEVSRYLDAAGKHRVTAYGFLMFVLEAIASRMVAKEDHLVCTATYSIHQWGHITYSHPNRVGKYLRLCEVIEWVQVEFEGSSCKVSIPKMVEWRDEYTRKSGPTPDKGAHSTEDESKQDKRENRDDGSLSDGFAGKEASRTPPHDFEITPELRQWAEKERPDIDIDYETPSLDA